jgi:hypothetical protein
VHSIAADTITSLHILRTFKNFVGILEETRHGRCEFEYCSCKVCSEDIIGADFSLALRFSSES